MATVHSVLTTKLRSVAVCFVGDQLGSCTSSIFYIDPQCVWDSWLHILIKVRLVNNAHVRQELIIYGDLDRNGLR